MALRLMSKGDLQLRNKEELTLVIGEDVQKFFEESKRKVINFPVDEPKLNIALGELRNMVGLHNIKKEIEEIVKLVKYYNDIGKDVKKSLSLHMVFTGSPGTGKTTVARIVIEIFKSLGILERGQMVECDRQDLISGYLGQTAIKTEELINKAIGGGLFIDEAYSLSQGGENDFGKEAIETLLKRMEDDRGRFMVIAAGYTDEMRRFLESNPGLISRFDKTLHFEDFSADELFLIGEKMLAIEQLFLNEQAATFFKNLVIQLLEKKNRFFGNARTIRKIVEQTVKKQNLRMADIPVSERSIEKIQEVILSDLENFSIEEGQTRKSSIGFNK
jgi:SpoVK/Ycf46/Vps4 family AAA+-type ATPase